MSVKCLKQGPMSTIQDAGRMTYLDRGFPMSGAADRYAMETANYLVGNKKDAAVLENTLMGPDLLFQKPAILALTGADMKATLDGVAVQTGKPVLALAGNVLHMGFAEKGCRGYLAVSGGFSVPEVMGSRSTCLAAKTGGYQGRTLKSGDELEIGDINFGEKMKVSPEISVIRKYQERLEKLQKLAAWREKKQKEYAREIYRNGVLELRIIPGPQAEWFSEETRRRFAGGIYLVQNQSDRMAIRLSGEALLPEISRNMISAGLISGSVQISSSGQPILMLADHQTTGGYPEMGAVCSVDVSRAAQLRPGETVCFRWITAKEGEKLLLAERGDLKKWEKKICRSI